MEHPHGQRRAFSSPVRLVPRGHVTITHPQP